MGRQRKLIKKAGKTPARPRPTLAAKMKHLLAGNTSAASSSGSLACNPKLDDDMNTADVVVEYGKPSTSPTPSSPSSINASHQLLDINPQPVIPPINASPKASSSSPSVSATLGTKDTPNSSPSVSATLGTKDTPNSSAIF